MNGIYPIQYTLYDAGRWERVEGVVTEEILLCVHVNGKELVSLMATPHDPDELALGYLRSEGVIRRLEDVRLLSVSKGGTCVDVWLDRPDNRPDNRPDASLPKRRIVTSGCGGGVTHDDLRAQVEPLRDGLTITPARIFERMHDLNLAATLYRTTQGIHASALTDGDRLLAVAEDIGRHNTIDRLWGKALKQGLPTRGLTLLSTGRISSEMLAKAVKMGIPIVASRTSATSLSASLGKAWNVTLIGYVRRGSLRVYSASQRIMQDEPVEAAWANG